MIEWFDVWGFDGAIRGMRNPKKSWALSDSKVVNGVFELGEKDKKLAQALIVGGGEHRKFMRMIHIQFDVRLPRYVWSEFDTYHFVTKNSESTMHKLFDKKRPIQVEDFVKPSNSYELDSLEETIQLLNGLRNLYLNETDARVKNVYLTSAKRVLPESYYQMRTVDTNYETLRNMYFQRRNHRLKEWQDFCAWIETLPYAKELICYVGETNECTKEM